MTTKDEPESPAMPFVATLTPGIGICPIYTITCWN